MNDVPNKEELLRRSRKAFDDLTDLCSRIPEKMFFDQPAAGEWSMAQHVQHLIISTRTATAPFALPRFIVRLIGGRSNRPGMTYDELVQKYKNRLAGGGKARGRYIPSPINPSTGRDRLLDQWTKATVLYQKALQKRYTEEQLDQYTVPHPLLGKITLRELAFFTMYHTGHHLNNIKRSLSAALRRDN